MKVFVAAMLAFATGCAALPGPRDLTIGEGLVDPIGFHDATPTFSWKLPDGIQKQSAYQIVVDQPGKTVWDSGWVKSDQSIVVPFGGQPFVARDRAEWRVRFRDQEGNESDWSETARFEMGLLSDDDWKAQWIRPAEAAGPQIEVLKAVFRSKDDPKAQQDVTDLVRTRIANRESIVASNEAMGGDPLYGSVKELVLTYLENGKKMESVLAEGGQWPEAAGLERVAMLRRGFKLDKPVAKARIYVTARGLFELTLNGQRVGNDHFANGWTSYHKRLDTVTYDVTEQVHREGNSIQACLGKGWYAGRIGFGDNQNGQYGKKAELLLQLEITYEDGSRDIIVSDGQWEGTFDGPVLSSSIYDGENYDARKKPAGWAPVVAIPDLGPARLVPKPFPPVREAQTLSVQNITEPESGRYVFDLGQNMVGWARINVPVKKDETVTIRFAEMLKDDGTLYTENYRSAKSTDTYTAAKTGTIEWEPYFTFHGFRYVELSGLPAGAKPKKDWVEGVVLHSDLRQVGSFESSNVKLNQLQSNIVWGWRGNSVDIPTDCPQRDERLGWTGDAQVFCPTAMFNTDALAFWKSWLCSMRDDQKPDGSIPDVIPAIFHWYNSPGWMDAATFVPWEVYVRSGDIGVLQENYAMMEKLVGWYRAQSVDGLLPNIKGYGDWLQPYSQKAGSGDLMESCHGDTPSPLLGAAFYARSAQIVAAAARALGRDADATRYAAEAAKVKSAFAAHYFDADGKLQNAPETQTAYILGIAFDLLPDHLEQKAAEHLVHLVRQAGDHMRTGFLGTPYIVGVLDQTGHTDLAAKLLFTETYPSWLYPIDQGATTMWERWNSYTRKDGFGNVEMNSFNHYAYGAIGQWMYERLAGLSPDPAHPGYKHFFVRPLIVKQLDWASARLDTPYGLASSGWARKNGKVVMEVVVPPNTTATIEFPDGRDPETVPTGTYRYPLQVK